MLNDCRIPAPEACSFQCPESVPEVLLQSRLPLATKVNHMPTFCSDGRSYEFGRHALFAKQPTLRSRFECIQDDSACRQLFSSEHFEDEYNLALGRGRVLRQVPKDSQSTLAISTMQTVSTDAKTARTYRTRLAKLRNTLVVVDVRIGMGLLRAYTLLIKRRPS